MDYSLLWKGRLWKVQVPQEIDTVNRWLYVQAFVVANGSHAEAMRTVFRHQYPGIGWSGFNGLLLPFGSFVSGHGFVSESDKSFPASASHSRSHKPRPPSSARSMTDAVSGTGVRHKPAPPHATSSGGRSPVHAGGAAGSLQRPTKTATPRTVGWMGSNSTSV